MDTNSKINIIWYNGFKGNWDHGLILSLIDGDDRFVQHNEKYSPVIDGAIIIIGKPNDIETARNYLSQFKKATVILASDEDAYWDWKNTVPDHLKICTQYYHDSKSDIKHRLLLGFPTELPQFLKKALLPKKDIFCSFVGQVQNPHRQACINELQKVPGHFLKIADGFGGVNGLNYQDYINIMLRSKVVLCPSGSMCTDSFRAYEALECGALPIVEARSPRDKKHFNYWQEVGANIFPCVSDWNDVHALLGDPEFIQERTKQCIEWWNNYKQELKNKLLSNF